MTNNDDENLGSFYMGKMRPPPEPERVLPRGALTVGVLLAFIVIIWWAYPSGEEKHADADLPVVKAETEAYKSAPEDPGGMEVRHQDSTVFDPLEKKADTVEKLMPEAEQPVNKEEVLDAEKPVLEGAAPKLNLEMQGQSPAVTEEKPAETPVEKPAEEPAPVVEMPKVVAETPKVVTGGKYIQLGAFRSKESAAKEWQMLQKKYPAQLKGLAMKTEKADLGAKGVLYRLQAGTLPEAKAKEVCATIKAASGNCILVK